MSSKTIDPSAYYTNADVENNLGIRKRTLGVACARGKLRFAAVGGDRYYLGQWLIDWLDGRAPSTTPDEHSKSTLAKA